MIELNMLWMYYYMRLKREKDLHLGCVKTLRLQQPISQRRLLIMKKETTFYQIQSSYLAWYL